MARSHLGDKQKRKKIQMREEKKTKSEKKSENRYAKTAEQRIFSHKMIPLRIFLLNFM